MLGVKLYPLVMKSVNPDTLEVSSEILSIPICEDLLQEKTFLTL